MVALLTVLLWIGVFHILWYRSREKLDQNGDSVPVLKIVERRLKKIDDVTKLEQWNAEWSHPETGDFYTWDHEHGYVETTKSERLNLAARKRTLESIRKRGDCSVCGETAHVRDRSTGFQSYCYACFTKTKHHAGNFRDIDT